MSTTTDKAAWYARFLLDIVEEAEQTEARLQARAINARTPAQSASLEQAASAAREIAIAARRSLSTGDPEDMRLTAQRAYAREQRLLCHARGIQPVAD